MRYLNHIFKIFDISKYRLLVRSRLIWSRSDRLFPVHFRLISAIRIIWQKIYCWDQWHPKLDILKHFRQLNSELFVVMRLSDISILTATSTTFFNYVHFRTTVSHFTSKIHVFDLLKTYLWKTRTTKRCVNPWSKTYFDQSSESDKKWGISKLSNIRKLGFQKKHVINFKTEYVPKM